jgi:ATP-dependent Clp endopeptidase proteolytic subunit ClpP
MKTSMKAVIQTFRASNPRARFQAKVVQQPKVAKKEDDTTTCGELYLYDAIGSDWYGGIGAKDVVQAVKEIEAAGASKLNIFINSPGGDVFEGTAIYNALARFKGTKHVTVDGLAASAASYIAMVGDTITTAFNAMWMIHHPWGLVIGNATQMRETAEMLDKVGGTLIDTYARRTKQSVDDLRAWMDAETWMTAAEAKDRGFTDTVTQDAGSGCDCGGACGESCACGGQCSDACECECDDNGASASLLMKFKNTPSSLRPAASKLLATMEQRVAQLPSRASPRRNTSGQPVVK